MSILDYLNDDENKIRANELVNFIDKNIDGRVCMSDHIYCLYLIGEYMKLNVYAEIGTLWGGSLSLILQLPLKDDAKFIGIDLFEGYYGKEVKKNDNNKCSQDITKDNHIEFVEINLEKFNKFNHNYHLIKGSSYDDETVENVKEITNSIDLLFIDGDHSGYGVTEDFMKYKDFITQEGYILFDNYGDPNHWTQVKPALDKIDFNKYNFNIIGQIGYSLLVQKKTIRLN